jgi:DNA gyrase subunit B
LATSDSGDSSGYSGSSITVLKGLEAVRMRPSMYIGSTGPRGLHHLVYEVIDNSIDESLAGHCKIITLSLNVDGSCTVSDDGRGIPVDMHEEEGRSAAEVVMTVLHAGGKFDNDSYKVSGGLHGVGVSCVNALSKLLILDIWRDGKHYNQEYKQGAPQSPMSEIGVAPIVDGVPKRGTRICFFPDEEIFKETVDFDFETLSTRLRELAFLNPGIRIETVDMRDNTKENFEYTGGLNSFVKYLNRGRNGVHEEPLRIGGTRNDVEIDLAIQWIESATDTVLSFVNNINTHEGGTHLSGFRAALTDTINRHALDNNLFSAKLKKGEVHARLEGNDIREGMTAVLSIRVLEPQFEGQTKTKLGNSEVKGLVQSLVNEKLRYFLDENPSVAKRIVARAEISQKARLAAKRARDSVRKNAMKNVGLPGKLSDCAETDPSKCEIYLVEGDSAGGSAKQGRDRKIQAILPLRGKIINVEKAREDKMLANNEIKTMISALGCGIGDVFDIERLRYHRIIIMTDADVDGSHIRTLLLTFFYRMMPELVINGHLYIAQPPLYRVKRGKKLTYLKDESAMENFFLSSAQSVVGVREMGASDETTLSQDTMEKFLPLLSQYCHRLQQIEHRMPASIADSFTYIVGSGLDQATLAASAEALQARLAELQPQLRILRVKADDSELALDIDVEVGAVMRSLRLSCQGGDLGVLSKRHQQLSEIIKLPVQLSASNMTRDVNTWPELLENLLDLSQRGYDLQRYKGLGEMNPDQLWETTMNPENRALQQIIVDDLQKANTMFETLMGDEVAPRREFIEKNALNVRNLDV